MFLEEAKQEKLCLFLFHKTSQTNKKLPRSQSILFAKITIYDIGLLKLFIVQKVFMPPLQGTCLSQFTKQEK